MELRPNWPSHESREDPEVPGASFDQSEIRHRTRRILSDRRSQSNRRNVTVYLSVFLFLLTGFTTLWAGAMLRGVSPGAVFSRPELLLLGFPYSFTLLFILGAHELGHYFASRRWGVSASLPYFIPAPPFFLLGTFGAIIRIRGPILDRRALLDVAVAGPLAGMAVALPAALIGLGLSHVAPQSIGGGGASFVLGESLLFQLASWTVLGGKAAEQAVFLHPVAFAGWCGFLVTSLNLIPAGQLDGGHIIYAILGRWHRQISNAAGVVLLGMSYWWPGWILWATLALLLGRRHPPLLNEWETLGKGRRFVGYSCMILMILTFTWVPLRIQ